MYTDQVTIDNLSLHAVSAPIVCRKITLRELATDVAPVGYQVAGSPGNAVFPMLQSETVVFEAPPRKHFQVGDIVGYLQSNAGTITFSRICQ